MGILDDAIREHLELKRRHGADAGEVERQEREILTDDRAAAADADAPAVEAIAEPAADHAAAPEAAYEEPGSLVGAPILEEEPAAPAPSAATDLFPSTGELLAAGAASEAAAPAPVAPAPAAPAPSEPALAAPAPAGADSETAARSGARRLSDEELAAWRRRLSERADKLAAQRSGAAEPAAPATPAPARPAAAARAPAPAAPAPAVEPASTWSAPAPTPAPATPAGGAEEHADAGVPRDFFDAGEADHAFGSDPLPPVADESHDVLDDTPEFLQETPEHDQMWFEQRPPRDFDFG